MCCTSGHVEEEEEGEREEEGLHVDGRSSHVKWITCRQGMARPQVADGEHGLRIWRVAANMYIQ
jgi:hypothetical protein